MDIRAPRLYFLCICINKAKPESCALGPFSCLAHFVSLSPIIDFFGLSSVSFVIVPSSPHLSLSSFFCRPICIITALLTVSKLWSAQLLDPFKTISHRQTVKRCKSSPVLPPNLCKRCCRHPKRRYVRGYFTQYFINWAYDKIVIRQPSCDL